MKKRCGAASLLLLVSFALGCAAGPGEGLLEIRLAQIDEIEGLRRLQVPVTGEEIYVHPEVVATERDVENAWPVELEKGYGVAMTLKNSAATRISRRLEGELWARLAIFVEGQLVGALPIWEGVNRDMVISGRWERGLAEYLASRLNPERKGVLPVDKLEKVEPEEPHKIDLLKRAREQRR